MTRETDAILYTWIGNADRKGSQGNKDSGPGPVADALTSPLATGLCRAVLLDERDDDVARAYPVWLEKQIARMNGPRIELERRGFAGCPAGGAIDYAWVFGVMRRVVEESTRTHGEHRRIYLVGPGTPTMSACTLVISRLASCRGELWQTDINHPGGVRALQLPFDLSLIDAPDPATRPDDALPGHGGDFVLEDPVMQRLWSKAGQVARSDYPLLVLGPTGAGKEVLARHIHTASGRTGEFVALNCGALPENLIEAQLFGHAKGAFTGAQQERAGVFESAANGTVFLDEIGDLPLAQQVKLLRVLQEKKVVRLGETRERTVDCRIVAATHRDLDAMIGSGDFREDLYYRLAALIFRLPPLAERPNDLAALIEMNWREIVSDNPGFPGKILTDDARGALKRYTWPGNVRELRQTLVRLAFWAAGPVVDATTVGEALREGRRTADEGLREDTGTAGEIPPGFDIKAHQREERYRWAQRALQQANGNQSRAARLLNLTPTHLARLLSGNTES